MVVISRAFPQVLDFLVEGFLPFLGAPQAVLKVSAGVCRAGRPNRVQLGWME
jgi:hypothetical protein